MWVSFYLLKGVVLKPRAFPARREPAPTEAQGNLAWTISADSLPGTSVKQSQLELPLMRCGENMQFTARRRNPHAGNFSHQPSQLKPHFATTKLFVTENAPGTPLARRPTIFLSAWLSTTPSSVTRPFFTMIRIGLITGIAYRCSGGYP